MGGSGGQPRAVWLDPQRLRHPQRRALQVAIVPLICGVLTLFAFLHFHTTRA
jgi:hypothetical protein